DQAPGRARAGIARRARDFEAGTRIVKEILRRRGGCVWPRWIADLGDAVQRVTLVAGGVSVRIHPPKQIAVAVAAGRIAIVKVVRRPALGVRLGGHPAKFVEIVISLLNRRALGVLLHLENLPRAVARVLGQEAAAGDR